MSERRAAAPPRLRAVEELDARLEALGTRGIIGVIIVLWILVIGSDLNTGPQLSFTLFYLMPIGIAAWYLGWRAGLAMALFGTFAWFVGDIVNGIAWTSQPVRYWNTAVRAGVFLVVAYAIAMLRYVIEEERDLARTDPLTGVSNWRHFSELAIRELSRARRYKKPIALAYVDVDNFKAVNDTLGHEAGNAVLRDIASAMTKSLRLTDVIARVGGDEFVLLLPDQGMEGAKAALAKVNHDLDAVREKYARSVGFSIGVIVATEAPAHVEALVQSADALMYQVKASGKSSIDFAILADASAGPLVTAGGT